MEKLHATTRWENETVPEGVTIKDLDAEEIQITLDNAIRLARFRGKDRLSDFTDNRQYWGHAFSLLRRAESFLLDHVPIAGRILPGKMIREDQPWYPPRATREALANALCHRDYTIPGGAVAIAMCDDHMEIVNPGAIQFGITPEKLTQPHESKPLTDKGKKWLSERSGVSAKPL